MIHINKYTLENGLRLIHSKDESTQMVALNILYDVGARDEDPNHTGFAHLFEHLMFGGSINIPDFDEPLQKAGGDNNAWTSNDITNYYVTIPKQNVEIAFWLESDRMLGFDFSEKSLKVQKHVVIEEFKQRNLNQPYGDISHLIHSLAYKVHPYQWPTIGKEIAHIKNATLDEVKDFFFRFYAPNNAILAITGNIEFEEAVRLTEKWFSSIPHRKVEKRNLPKEPKQPEKRTLLVERHVPSDVIYIAFHMCERTNPDYYAFDMLSDILANGDSSRLFRNLVREQQLFSGIDAYISGSIEPGLFHIMGKPAPGISIEDAEKSIWAELELLKQSLIKEEELEKVKNKYESNHIFNNINYQNVATNLALHELTGKAEDINYEVDKYRNITSKHIQDIAKATFLQENSSTLYYIVERNS